jgi:hypothetical protein
MTRASQALAQIEAEKHARALEKQGSPEVVRAYLHQTRPVAQSGVFRSLWTSLRVSMHYILSGPVPAADWTAPTR